jgi:hypothetical protein
MWLPNLMLLDAEHNSKVVLAWRVQILKKEKYTMGADATAQTERKIGTEKMWLFIHQLSASGTSEYF